jgi:hypothetical protein
VNCVNLRRHRKFPTPPHGVTSTRLAENQKKPPYPSDKEAPSQSQISLPPNSCPNLLCDFEIVNQMNYDNERSTLRCIRSVFFSCLIRHTAGVCVLMCAGQRNSPIEQESANSYGSLNRHRRMNSEAACSLESRDHPRPLRLHGTIGF